MKVAVISDTHGTLPDIPPEADAVIHCGDVGPDRYYDLADKKWVSPLEWFRNDFHAWATRLKVPVYMTWGNHDRIGQDHPEKAFWEDLLPANVRVLVDEATTIGAERVWFSPWSPLFGNWAFMLPEGELREKYKAIDTSIIVSHTPPWGHGDTLQDGSHVGSLALLDFLADRTSGLVLCGHIHNGRGTSMLRDIRVRNVACMDEVYEPIPNGPVLVDWPA
ncbi:MAG: metallophosphoesterase [Actinobacteria bacterium]|nr:metallophosphoesterase [Actinomycetota bacterium]